MISVQQIYLRLNDLLKKETGGFMSNDAFNRLVNEVQKVLFLYWSKKFEESQEVVDALQPFITEQVLQIVDGLVGYPPDYRRLSSVWYRYVVNSGTEPETREWLLDSVAKNEDVRGYRRPLLGKPQTYRYEQLSDSLRVMPVAAGGTVRLKYLKTPPDASRAVTYNGATFDEDYNAGSTVDLQWPASEFSNILSLMLLSKGVETEKGELITFAVQQMKNEAE